MRSVRTILVPQRSSDEPYSLMLDLSENNSLVDQINQELYDPAIIKNSRLLVAQKKKDIREVHNYIKKKELTSS